MTRKRYKVKPKRICKQTRSGPSCFLRCPAGYTIDDNNNCNTCPEVENGTFTNNCEYKCNSGYVKMKDKCCPDVQNGTFTTANSCAYKCNSGYVKKNNKCEKKLTTVNISNKKTLENFTQNVSLKPFVWGVNASDNIYKRPIDGSWTQIPGGLKHVSASGDGWIWGVNSSDNIYKCKKPCNGEWTQVSGGLKQISGGDTEVWGVDASDNIWKQPIDGGGSWTQISGGLKHVSASGDGWIWGVDSSDNIYKCKKPCNGEWTQVNGGLKQISGGNWQ